ncbi:MFS transporter [Maribacter thermophilus]|uniref:MFS transporter n=1 Tax=Maribacter thermophilus TaxID=1197874 RepID=UPI000641151F|nr:MFS transporter [Maribacter thermophilus]
MRPKPYILPVIIIAQFACTSPWFAGNTIIDDLALKTGIGNEIVGYIISSVQLGFITGTLFFALFIIADRFSPSKVFMVCALITAAFNFSLLMENISKWPLLIARFGTGFFLAGIYPVGMKIAADYYKHGLGKALGFLVGALVLGTAFPYLINGTSWGDSPEMVIKTTSVFTAIGGVFLFVLVPNGPYRKSSKKLNFAAGPKLFRSNNFKKAAFGYFGHMWELYAFWTYTPFAIKTFNDLSDTNISIPLFTGTVIALGGISCAIGGLASQRYESKKIALIALFISGVCCLFSPFLFTASPYFFIIGWCVWGMAVTADSPQFSNLVANAVSPELKGTGLTIVNSIGFALSIVSIQLLSFLSESIPPTYIFLILALGPIFGLWQLGQKRFIFNTFRNDESTT